MSVLSREAIRLNATATNKEDAIQQAGELLVSTACVMPEYVNGMLAREKTMSTYLGSGVSIPHGEYENYAHILKTGISIVQVREGVSWEEDEKAYLVIGIAASSDEHVGLLSRLAEVIEDEETLQKMIQAEDAQVLIHYLDEA